MRGLFDDAIGNLERRRLDAMLAGDHDSLRNLISSVCTYVHSNGRIDTGRAYLDNFAAGIFDYGAIDVSEQSVTITGDVAVVAYLQTAVLRIGDDRHTAVTRCTAVWTRESGVSQLIAFQSTPIRS